MLLHSGFRRLGLPFFLIFLIIPTGCSDDGTGPGELKPLVGVWDALELVMTSQTNPDISVDLIEEGAAFTLSILSNGQYTATLTIFEQGTSEMGNVQISGNTVTITPTQPEGPALEATWSFQGERLVLDGESEFDFNLDGTTEASFVHIVLEPRGN